MSHNSRPHFPQDYIGDKATKYNNTKWMERNQKKTTLKCINYLYDPKLGSYRINLKRTEIVLDLGCGTGFSSEVLVEQGFKVVAIEILTDMINLALKRKKEKALNQLELILADIRYIPVRRNSIDHMISISAYNFIINRDFPKENWRKTVLDYTARRLYGVLRQGGRIIIEFYPKDKDELEEFSIYFSRNQFKGYYIEKKKPSKSGAGGQTFFLLRK